MLILEIGNRIYCPKFFNFSAGELHTNLSFIDSIPDNSLVRLKTLIKSSDDLMKLMLVNNALINMNPTLQRVLELRYMPYSRQDRVCAPGDPYSLKVMCDILHTGEFNRINVDDLHSTDAYTYLDNLFQKEQYNLIGDLFPVLRYRILGLLEGGLCFVSPDKGARGKVIKSVEELGLQDTCPVICLNKVRDTTNGNITRLELSDKLDAAYLRGNQVIITDDICDGGKTFIEAAKLLKECGATKVILYITHGIFSKGFEELDKYIDEYYVYNYIGNGPIKSAKPLTVATNK